MSGFPQTNSAVSADLQRTLQPNAGNPAPSDELGAIGPDVRDCVRDAVASLTGRPALNAVKTGTRSEVLLNALEPARAAIERQVYADLGATSDTLPATHARLVGAFSEVTLMRESIFLRMAGQPSTNKGRSRSLLGAYVSLVDREMRLAQLVGLERKQKSVVSPLDYIAGKDA